MVTAVKTVVGDGRGVKTAGGETGLAAVVEHGTVIV